MPNYSIIHKQDIFITEKYRPDIGKDGPGFLSRSFERHFNERPYLNHTCYLFLTKTTRERSRQQSNWNMLCRKFLVPKEIQDRETMERFMESVGQFESIVNDSGLARLERLSTEEITGTEDGPGIIERYLTLSSDGSVMLQDMQLNPDGMRIGDKRLCLHTLNCTLTADIDLTGKDWTRIGTWPGYSGVFNGQGHRITGLNISAATTELFGLLNVRGVIKNLQLIDVNLYGSSGSAAGIVEQNEGQIIACSVTGKISAYGRTCGIADLNYGSITACWFDGTLKEYESGAIVRYNYNTITSCYWGGNAGQGVFRNHGGTVDATKVDGATAKWQTAVDGMNPALTGNDYQWALGTDGLPVLKRNNNNP